MYVIECLQAAGYHVVTHVLSKSEKCGAVARRWRLYFLGIRVPKAISNNTERLSQVTQAIHDFSAAMNIGSSNVKDFVDTSVGTVEADAGDDDPEASQKAERK